MSNKTIRRKWGSPTIENKKQRLLDLLALPKPILENREKDLSSEFSSEKTKKQNISRREDSPQIKWREEVDERRKDSPCRKGDTTITLHKNDTNRIKGGHSPSRKIVSRNKSPNLPSHSKTHTHTYTTQSKPKPNLIVNKTPNQNKKKDRRDKKDLSGGFENSENAYIKEKVHKLFRGEDELMDVPDTDDISLNTSNTNDTSVNLNMKNHYFNQKYLTNDLSHNQYHFEQQIPLYQNPLPIPIPSHKNIVLSQRQINQKPRTPVERIERVQHPQILINYVKAGDKILQKRRMKSPSNDNHSVFNRLFSIAQKQKQKRILNEIKKTENGELDCSFTPEIDKNSEKIMKEKSARQQEIGDKLYNYHLKYKAKQQSHRKNRGEDVDNLCNISKVSKGSDQYAKQKLEKDLLAVMNHLDPETNQYINFNLIGTFLYYIRILQVIFNPSYAIFPNKLGQYHQNQSLMLSDKFKTRKDLEIDFFKSFCSLLQESNENENSESVSKALVFDLITLIYDTTDYSLEVLQNEVFFSLFHRNLNESIKFDDSNTQTDSEEENKQRDLIKQVLTKFIKLNKSKLTLEKSNFINTHGLLQKPQLYSFKPAINHSSRKLDSERKYEKSFEKQENVGKNVSKKSQRSASPRIRRFEWLYDNFKERQMKLEREREERDIEEEKKLTFKPNITKQARLISDQKNDSNKKAYERLWNESQKKKKKSEFKTLEEREMEGCTFNPHFMPKINSTECITLPSGFKKNINRLRSAHNQRINDHELREKIPTGENYERIRKLGIECFELSQNIETKITDKKVIFVDVNIAPGKKLGRVAMHEGDNPLILAQNFAKIFSLSHEMRDELTLKLQRHMKQKQHLFKQE